MSGPYVPFPPAPLPYVEPPKRKGRVAVRFKPGTLVLDGTIGTLNNRAYLSGGTARDYPYLLSFLNGYEGQLGARVINWVSENWFGLRTAYNSAVDTSYDILAGQTDTSTWDTTDVWNLIDSAFTASGPSVRKFVSTGGSPIYRFLDITRPGMLELNLEVSGLLFGGDNYSATQYVRTKFANIGIAAGLNSIDLPVSLDLLSLAHRRSGGWEAPHCFSIGRTYGVHTADRHDLSDRGVTSGMPFDVSGVATIDLIDADFEAYDCYRFLPCVVHGGTNQSIDLTSPGSSSNTIEWVLEAAQTFLGGLWSTGASSVTAHNAVGDFCSGIMRF